MEHTHILDEESQHEYNGVGEWEIFVLLRL